MYCSFKVEINEHISKQQTKKRMIYSYICNIVQKQMPFSIFLISVSYHVQFREIQYLISNINNYIV